MKPLPLPPPLFTAEEISARVATIGEQIGATYEGEDLVIVGLLKNSLVFMADLMRAIPIPFRSYTLRVVHVSETPGGPTALQVLYPGPLAAQWITRPNTNALFGGIRQSRAPMFSLPVRSR